MGLLQSPALPLGYVATTLSYRVERVVGIEPTHQPWEGRRLPLHHTREPQRPARFVAFHKPSYVGGVAVHRGLREVSDAWMLKEANLLTRSQRK